MDYEKKYIKYKKKYFDLKVKFDQVGSGLIPVFFIKGKIIKPKEGYDYHSTLGLKDNYLIPSKNINEKEIYEFQIIYKTKLESLIVIFERENPLASTFAPFGILSDYLTGYSNDVFSEFNYHIRKYFIIDDNNILKIKYNSKKQKKNRNNTLPVDTSGERILELKEWTVDNYHKPNAEIRDEVYNRQSKRDPLNRRDSVDAFLQLSQAYRDIIVHTMEHTDSNKIKKLKNANNIIEYTTPFDR
tara:strand:- start:995 stop:1723 length:729 start_codon:yes stop_codon:yes gene_type:complete